MPKSEIKKDLGQALNKKPQSEISDWGFYLS
jgi:hypothetical protein